MCPLFVLCSTSHGLEAFESDSSKKKKRRQDTAREATVRVYNVIKNAAIFVPLTPAHIIF